MSETDAPLVTVGLPVYNGARYIREAVASILGQTLGNLELLISDNGSDDGTEEICTQAAAADRRVKYFREDVNRGAAWNFNRVLELSRGSYFHWAAADDRFEPTYLERCLALLTPHPDAVLAYATTKVIDDNGEPKSTWRPRPGYATDARPADRFKDVLWHSVMCFEVFGVMRRDVLLQTAGIRPFTSSDRALLAELALRGSFGHVDEPLFVNRVHRDDSMHRNPDAANRAKWFDPQAPAAFPRWRLARALTGMAWAASPTRRDRLAALTVIPQWMWRERGALVYDILRALPGPTREWAARTRDNRRAARRAIAHVRHQK